MLFALSERISLMYCILIAGVPAGGKSTIARYLSKELKLPIISKDSVKEIMFDDIGFKSRSEKVALGIASMHIMYYMAEQLLRAGQPLILENNFEDSSVPKLMELLTRCDCTAITVRLTGDYNAIYDRFAKRDQGTERHRGHIVNDCYPEPEGAPKENPTMLTREGYLSSIEKRGFDRFTGNGPCIVVDTTDFSKIDWKGVVKQVKEAAEAL